MTEKYGFSIGLFYFGTPTRGGRLDIVCAGCDDEGGNEELGGLLT
jgi:hypothetical protein